MSTDRLSLDEEKSYILGLFQADGHLHKTGCSSGCFTISLQKRDRPLLEEVRTRVPFPIGLHDYVVDTNFKQNYEHGVLSCASKEACAWINDLGVPYGRKSEIVAPPTIPFSEPDYYRGIIDGDGSLGLTAKGRIKPFLSIVTASEALKVGYVEFLRGITGKGKKLNRNKRDNVYNICLYTEDAQKATSVLYYPGCFAMPRKLEKAEDVMGWVRPAEMRVVEERNEWTQEEDRIVRKYPVETAAQILGRSCSSVANRRFRLRQVTSTEPFCRIPA